MNCDFFAFWTVVAQLPVVTDGFSFSFLECGIVYPAMMPGQIPDPSVTAGALPGLGPLTGLPGTTLTAEELKYADIRNIGAMISPLHFLEVKLGKRPQPVKNEVSSENVLKWDYVNRCLQLPTNNGISQVFACRPRTPG